MANKDRLRILRENTIINGNSEKREGKVFEALLAVNNKITKKFGIRLHHESKLYLKEIVEKLQLVYSNVPFFYNFETSYMSPDGGILYMLDKNEKKYPILITEVKNQGTNDIRAKEGKKKQAKGNAIERLGKNVIGFRTALMNEDIFPFVCFGDGCDFESDSSILDRVVTINMFGKLNEIVVKNLGPRGEFNRGSFFFRPKKWTPSEMAKIMSEIAERSVHYYFSKYGESLYK